MKEIYNKFPDLKKFSKHIGFSEEKLLAAFKIEIKYHNLILNESDKIKRKDLYNSLYKEVHQIYYGNSYKNGINDIPFTRKALLYKKELKNKSILEVGCGQGSFLISVSKSFKTKKLTGLDVSLPPLDVINSFPNINFIETNITDFNLNEKYDIVYSNHVLEHMAPLDLDSHLNSLKKILNPGGKLIVNMPNRLFGPSDVSRIIDFSYTNKFPAIGSHFFESTYEEIIENLKKHGFNKFISPIPHTLIRHILPFIRINSHFISNIEKSKWVINFLHSIKYNGRCRLNFEVSIIAGIPNE